MSDNTPAAPVAAGGAGVPSFGGFAAWAKRGDIALALGIITILVVLILPMPAMILDGLLAISIILSVLVMMTALFIHTPLEFSAFPAVLLIATMLRLALNLASTRLILANGHEGTDAAGHVIEAFGDFVVGGNYAVGLKEHIVFPEIDYDKVDEIWGMDVVICTTAKTDDEARELLRNFNFPFRS